MKGLQITEPGKYRIVDVAAPEPYPDEVLVEIKVCNSCTHWDLTVWNGIDKQARLGYPRFPQPVGRPGHEWSGVVVAKGDQVRTLQIGDRVANWGSPPGTRRLRQERGEDGYGAYAQLAAAHELSVLSFPEGLSWGEMAMLEILSCIAQGAVKAGDLTGKRVAVFGLGPVGLMMVQALKSRGPDQLTGIDLNPARCELALALGADRVIQPGSKEWAALRPDEFQYSVDTAGGASPASIEAALEYTAGPVQIFSVPYSGGWRMPQSARQRKTTVEYPETPAGRPGRYARHLLISGQVNVKPLLSAELPIEDYGRGIDLLRKQEAFKISFTTA